MNTLKSFLHGASEHPLRTLLSVVAIALGVGILILALNLSWEVQRFSAESFGGGSRRIVIANAEIGEDGNPVFDVLPQFDASTIEVLSAEYPELEDLTPVNNVGLRVVEVNGARYRLRSVVGTGPTYADLMDLELVAGSFFTQQDVDDRRRVAVLSESAAAGLFGSADAALGQAITPAATSLRFAGLAAAGGAAGDGGRFVQSAMEDPYRVVGVYRDRPEVEREAFGIADVAVPYSTAIPGTFDVPMGMLMRTLVGRVSGASPAEAEARISDILTRLHTDDLVLAVWEGSHTGANDFISNGRDSLARLSTTLLVLGVVILVAATVGMFSMTLVEVLARSREIGLRRALGASQAGIVRFFLGQSALTAVLGSVAGIVLAMVFHGSLVASLEPFFASLALSDLSVGLPGPLPILVAVSAAAAATLVFAFFPTMAAARTPIIESIREDAA